MHYVLHKEKSLIITWVGGNDRRLALFENLFPSHARGVSYNSYLIMDEKTALVDTADASLPDNFWKISPTPCPAAAWTT